MDTRISLIGLLFFGTYISAESLYNQMFPDNPYGTVVDLCLQTWAEIDRLSQYKSAYSPQELELFIYAQVGRLTMCAEYAHLLDKQLLNEEDRSYVVQLISALSNRFLMLKLDTQYQRTIQELLQRIKQRSGCEENS